MSKYHKTFINLFIIKLCAMTFNSESVMAGKTTWILYLGPDAKQGQSYKHPFRQLRISWGWIGNCHPFYISFKQGGNHFVTICTRHLETTIYHSKNYNVAGAKKWWWNSEHIAKHLGEYHCNTDEYDMPIGGGPADWYAYDGWLGRHDYV